MKYALVTGGSRGIGQAVCLKLAEMGYHILINYQSNDTEAEATLQQIREQGSDGELMKFDVTDAVATHAALNGWMEKHPDTYIEVLVNNAGIRRDNLMLWMEQDEWSRVLDISLNGFFNVTQPLLKKYAGKAIRTYHQHRFPVGYQRNAGTNQLFSSQRRNDSRHQSTGTGSGQKTRDGERRSTGIYPHGYDQRH